MQRIKVILGIAALALTITAAWQIVVAEIANLSFQDEIHDMASQASARIGLAAPVSDEDFTRDVIQRASQHGIGLRAKEITIYRPASGVNTVIVLSADYHRPISLGLFSFQLHFTPSSNK